MAARSRRGRSLPAGRLQALGETELPASIRLLLACARAAVDPGSADRVAALLEESVDWTEVVRLALQHGLTPLLGAGLEGTDGVPAEIRQAMDLHLAENASRHAVLYRELFELTRALERRGVQAIPFKGPTLAELAFGHGALRRVGDLDLLVRRESIEETCRVLRESGYREWIEYATGRSLSDPENTAYGRYQCEYLFIRPRDAVNVEPHWALAPPSLGLPLDLAGFWSRAGPRRFRGGQLWSLALEDLLLALCVHAAKHEWEELRWIADVSALLRRHPELDLEVALARARSQHCTRILLLGLELARTLFGSALPGPIEDGVRNERIPRQLAGEVVSRLACPGAPVPSVFALSRFRLRLLDRRRDRVRSVLRTLATPQVEHLRTVRLPASLFFLYVPLKLAHDYVALPIWIAAKRLGGAIRRTHRIRTGARLLVVDWIPYVHEGAGFPRMNALLRLLVGRGYAITLHPVLPCDASDPGPSTALPEIEIVRGRGIEQIEEFLREHAGRFSALLVSRPPTMRAIAAAFARNPALRQGLRVAYDAEAIFALREIRRREVLDDPPDPDTARHHVADECNLATGADAVIAASEGEAEVFRRHGVAQVFVLPHAVRPRPTPRAFAERSGLLFVGRVAEDDWPNTDGLVWFLDNVFQRVRGCLRDRGEEARLRVVGMTGARRLAERRDPGLEILGVASDLRPFFDEARMLVAPIRFSAGVPLKVYDAAAYGLPVVATRALADQLGWRSGRDLLAAEASNPVSFVEQVVELYTRADLWTGLRESALARVAEECSPERAVATLEAALTGT